MNTNLEARGASARADEPLHVMRWTYDRDHAKAEAVCLAAPDADCRLVPADNAVCQCEFYGRIERREDGTIWHLIAELDGKGYIPQPGDWHQMIPGDDCNACLFINESGWPEECTPEDEDHEFVIATTPFEPVWENDGCSWRPIHGDTRQLAAAAPKRGLRELIEGDRS